MRGYYEGFGRQIECVKKLNIWENRGPMDGFFTGSDSITAYTKTNHFVPCLVWKFARLDSSISKKEAYNVLHWRWNSHLQINDLYCFTTAETKSTHVYSFTQNISSSSIPCLIRALYSSLSFMLLEYSNSICCGAIWSLQKSINICTYLTSYSDLQLHSEI